MKRTLLCIAAASALAAASVPAFAQGPRPSDWQPLSQRQASIEQRIDQGVRSGQLTRHEARDLRSQFNGLLRLEARYNRDGLNLRERTDLQQRFDALSSRVRFEKHDSEDRYHPAGR